MPVERIPRFSNDMSNEELKDALVRMGRLLEYLMYHQDHDNVKRLHTEHCTIQSEYGETEIEGPQLKMFDAQAGVRGSTSPGTLRLKMGYDKTSGDFVFEMFNVSGVKTVGIDSSGNATFTGTIEGSDIIGSIITGGTFQTGETGDRITITNNTLLTYKDYSGTDYLNGIAWGEGVESGGTYGDVYLYDQGTAVLQFYNNLTGAGYTIKALNSARLGLGGAGTWTDAFGDWNFTNANISGLATSTVSDHNHGIPNGTELATAGGGSVTFVESGGHSHSVDSI